MRKTRVIPVLLLKGNGLVKTVKFTKPAYLGDPVNIVRIFNEKEVDEIALVDITATAEKRKPRFDLIGQIASECFMPLSYGGGVRDVEDIRRLLALGIEKVCVNTHAAEQPSFVKAAAQEFGSQSIVASIDVRKSLFGRYEVYAASGSRSTRRDPVDFARQMEEMGAGEILLNSIDLDGTMQGYDIELISRVSSAVGVPVVACGGAATSADFRAAVERGGASAVAAGSMFVYQGRHRAVLISYPDEHELAAAFGADAIN